MINFVHRGDVMNTKLRKKTSYQSKSQIRLRYPGRRPSRLGLRSGRRPGLRPG